MTDQQQKWVQQLARCSFLPGSYEKRFVRDLEGYAPDKELTEKQAAFLEKIAYRYRVQRGEPGMMRPDGAVDEEEKAKLQAWNEGRPL